MLKKSDEPFVVKIPVCNMIANLNSTVTVGDCAFEFATGRIGILQGYLSECGDAPV